MKVNESGDAQPTTGYEDIFNHCLKTGRSLREMVDFTLFTNPLGPSEKAKHAMRKAIKAMNRFPDPSAHYLKKLIGRLEDIAQDRIVFGHGFEGLLERLLLSVNPATVLVSELHMKYYRESIRRIGADMATFTLTEDSGIPGILRAPASDRPYAKVVILSNPDLVRGTTFGNRSIADIVRSLSQSNMFVIIDERLSEYGEGRSSAASTVDLGNFAVLRSFSYFYCLAGESVDYALCDGSIARRISDFSGPIPVSITASAGAIASLRDKGFAKRTKDFLATEKEYLLGRISQIPLVAASNTDCNFVLLSFETPIDDLRVELRKRNILIEEPITWGERYVVRIPVRRRPHNARFVKTLARLLVPGRRAQLPASPQGEDIGID
jgi:histidinol-phosphate/aromatic aminotransferase/cobyric acid decarboxylase-like protein